MDSQCFPDVGLQHHMTVKNTVYRIYISVNIVSNPLLEGITKVGWSERKNADDPPFSNWVDKYTYRL